MNVIILGAGASKAYGQSPTSMRMPIARDFFETFEALDMSSNPWVLIGDIVNYLRDYHSVVPDDFGKNRLDIEVLHTEIESKLFDVIDGQKVATNRHYRAYMQLIFLFNSVINEIQNGPVSNLHVKLAQILKEDDTVLTFNWDTLMDRAMKKATNWTPDRGYYCKPNAIYRNGWCNVEECSDYVGPLLIKLHGSTNWITSYLTIENEKFTLTQESEPDAFFVYELTDNPYDTYDGRYMDGYQPYSYGYYPPNIPDAGKRAPEGYLVAKTILRNPWTPKGDSGRTGLVSMPLIIPPVENKSYELFGTLFSKLWRKAEDVLVEAEKIIIIGYSFPKTDYQSNELFLKAFNRRTSLPEVIIINPNPDYIESKFKLELGIPEDKLIVYRSYFDKNFSLDEIFK